VHFGYYGFTDIAKEVRGVLFRHFPKKNSIFSFSEIENGKNKKTNDNSHIFVQKIHDHIENQKINQKYIHPISSPRLFGKVIQFQRISDTYETNRNQKTCH
jgi:hypothetical protein